ncbi:Uncharacterised protein [Vibrio cholerae]|nr:Uncharacterised protein [Vibrio cholerae]
MLCRLGDRIDYGTQRHLNTEHDVGAATFGFANPFTLLITNASTAGCTAAINAYVVVHWFSSP